MAPQRGFEGECRCPQGSRADIPDRSGFRGPVRALRMATQRQDKLCSRIAVCLPFRTADAQARALLRGSMDGGLEQRELRLLAALRSASITWDAETPING